MQVENDIRLDRVMVHILHPGKVQAARGISRKSCIGITVGENDFAARQGWFDNALCTIKMVSGIEQAVGQRPQHWAITRTYQDIRDKRRGTPRGCRDPIALGQQPIMEKLYLRGAP